MTDQAMERVALVARYLQKSSRFLVHRTIESAPRFQFLPLLGAEMGLRSGGANQLFQRTRMGCCDGG